MKDLSPPITYPASEAHLLAIAEHIVKLLAPAMHPKETAIAHVVTLLSEIEANARRKT